MTKPIDARNPLVPEDRTAVLIDGPAFLYMARRYNVKVDYDKLLSWFNDQTIVATNHFHAVTHADELGVDKIRKFLDYLRYNGWSVRDRPANMIFNHEEQKSFPDTNLTHVICADMAKMLISGKYEQILLVGSDPKYVEMVEVARDAGVRIVIMSSKKLGLIDKSLMVKADGFVEFADVCEEFSTSEGVTVHVA